MFEIYLLMLMTGLTGGFGHCLGMCGPVVASYSVSLPAKSIVPHLLYHAGRITTYMLLGAIMGIGGMLTNGLLAGGLLTVTCCQAAVSPNWLVQIPMLIAGGLIIIMGLSTAGALPVGSFLEKCVLEIPIIRKLMPVFSGQSGVGYFYPMGLLLGLLPCGLLYSALMTAVRAGMEATHPVMGILQGMVLMLLFGLGTAVSLLAFGKVAGLVGDQVRQRFYRLSGILVVIMGIYFIAKVFH